MHSGLMAVMGDGEIRLCSGWTLKGRRERRSCRLNGRIALGRVRENFQTLKGRAGGGSWRGCEDKLARRGEERTWADLMNERERKRRVSRKRKERREREGREGV